ncbi:MAG: PD-(D/E)XK nuclease family protein [Romboutsia sp.]|nr:PD-(D/E)XK nuclease family protein [Romboutsia sp.]
MSLKFIEKDHSYISEDDITWTSVTSLISKFKQPFDADEVAIKSSKNKKSKWYNMSPEDIKDVWKKEGKRATDLGTWYHNMRENDLLSCETIGDSIPVNKPIYEADGAKVAPNQKLKDGIYPEHFVYLKSAGICGQADYVEVKDGQINILDYKSNKEIKTESYKNWEGLHKMMNPPLSHLQDCNLTHYTLQMSIYMYMMLRHNPKLKPGTLTIQHILFEKVGDDEYGYPITLYDDMGNPVIKEIINYDVPYLKDEVVALIKTYAN